MSAQHTPGPWFDATPWAFNKNHIVRAGDPIDGPLVATLHGAHGADEVAANGRLIAAAPALLAELQNIANANPAQWGDERDQFQAWAQNRARYAIAKATGSTT